TRPLSYFPTRRSSDLSIDPRKGDYSGSARAEAIDFPSLTQHYLDYHESKGSLGGTYQFQGRGEEVRNLSGKGTLEVANGNVFARSEEHTSELQSRENL